MRLVNRTSVLFLGSIVSAGLVACGGDDGGGDDVITGTDNTFVVSKVQLPASANEATMLGLDIDDVAGDSNNGIDNQLGTFLGSLRGIAPGLDLQTSLDESVDTASVLLLANVKATDLTNANGAGMWVYIGDGTTATPAACTDANDTVCRHHLDGTGMFTIEAGTQTDAKLAGRIMAGKFSGGPGTINLQLSLNAGSPPLDLPLTLAKAEINVSANGFGAGSKLGGAILQTDIESKIHPAIQGIVTDLVDRDCVGTRTPPMCGCPSGSTGASVLGFLDTAMPRDCVVSLAEVTSTLNSLLTTDIDVNKDGTNDAVSLGIGVLATKGTFTVPQ
ncbi:MAG: hypothetical protein IPL61_20350 [Myxococcales bacterium]|nr:hypothetical protein [Myxococcales bacterium]